MDKLSRKKGKKVKATPTEASQKTKEVDDGAVDSNATEFVTTVRTRNDLLIDYTQIHNVKERLEILTQERSKGKFNIRFHI
jgi:translation initiation factor 3 subunit C